MAKSSWEWKPFLADLIWKDKKRDQMQHNYAFIRSDQISTITYSAMPDINKCFKSLFAMLIAKLIFAKVNNFCFVLLFLTPTKRSLQKIIFAEKAWSLAENAQPR